MERAVLANLLKSRFGCKRSITGKGATGKMGKCRMSAGGNWRADLFMPNLNCIEISSMIDF